jgi:lipopolysaccharide biosynthesis glycosyltransferase
MERNFNNIHIALASDARGVLAMATTIVSALHNKNVDNFYIFYLFLASDVNSDLQEKLKACVKGFEESCQINLIDLKDKFSNVKTSNYITYAAYFRLLIPSFLPDLKKIIYMDIDILVRHDLKELWDFDVGENYIAGVPNYYGVVKDRKRHLQAGILSTDFCINSGVLLMNLEKMREDGIEQKCLAKIDINKSPDDQFILNIVCCPEIAFLPSKWNMTKKKIMSYDGYIRRYDIFCSPGELNDAWNNPAIFHWTGPEKPWKYYDIPFAHEWFRYYLKTQIGSEILQRKACVSGIKKIIRSIMAFLRDGTA